MRFIGVHHRHQLSIAEVEDAIYDERPCTVCVELPPDDYQKFLETRSYLETEMKVAMITACDIGAEVYLIDWEKSVLRQRLHGVIKGGSIELWEKFEGGDIPGFLWRAGKEGFRLGPVQEVLIRERDLVMAEKIARVRAIRKCPMVAVMGASHVQGVRVHLEDPMERQALIGRKGIVVGEPYRLSRDEIYVYY